MSVVKIDTTCRDIILDSSELELIEIYLDDKKLDESRYVVEKESLKKLLVILKGRDMRRNMIKRILNFLSRNTELRKFTAASIRENKSPTITAILSVRW